MQPRVSQNAKVVSMNFCFKKAMKEGEENERGRDTERW